MKFTVSNYNAIQYNCAVFGNNIEEEQYFYHSDHLGSSAWITDASGNVNQHLQYMPFGESFIDQRSEHDIRYKFTGKERDEETGFDYFGARYYSSDLSIWLSVDPLASMYPSMSPYAYVYNNPINFIDEWGLEGKPKHSRFRKFLAKVNPWEISNGNKIHKSQFHIGKFHFGKGNQVLAKREVLPKEKNNYEDVNIVYHTKKEKNVDLTYQYKDAPIKTYTENETVPTNPFPSGYSGSSTYTVNTGDDMTSSKSKWNNADGKTVSFTLSLSIDYHYWYKASGNRPAGSLEPTGYSTTYKASSKPMSYRVPKGMFGRLKYRKKVKITDNSKLRTVHRSWP